MAKIKSKHVTNSSPPLEQGTKTKKKKSEMNKSKNPQLKSPMVTTRKSPRLAAKKCMLQQNLNNQNTIESYFNKTDEDVSSPKTKQKSAMVTRQANKYICKSPEDNQKAIIESSIKKTDEDVSCSKTKRKISLPKSSRVTRQTNKSTCKSPDDQNTLETSRNKTDINMNVSSSSKMPNKEHRSGKLDSKHASSNNISIPEKENSTLKKTNSKWIKPGIPPRKSPRVAGKVNSYICKSPSNQKTIKSYFNKADKNMNGSSSKISNKEHRFDKLNIEKCSPHKSSMKFKSCISPSAKFEGKVPKIDDILRTREESDKYVELKKKVEASAENFLKENKVKRNLENSNSCKPIKRRKMINCKHLSLPDIKKLFQKDVDFLDAITFDKVYNKRHELFKIDTPKNNCTKNDLRVNETTCMFTEDQLIYIVSLFRDRYDNGNIYKKSSFYFKVLLPEYCLKIFIECHKMTQKAALEYLKSTPVPNYFGFFE